MSELTYTKDSDGIVIATFDRKDHPINMVDEHFAQVMDQLLTRLESESGLTGVILTSAKSTFFAGANIKQILDVDESDLPYWRDLNLNIKAQLRRWENLPVPTVAAINGAALGGGYEICLATHHRIAIASEKPLIGLPEVNLGLLAGGGGIVRLTRLLGLEKALPILLGGKAYSPAEARLLGLIDTVAGDRESMMAEAKSWILANSGFVQPWNRDHFTIPGGTHKTDPGIQALVQSYPARLNKQFQGNVPAAHRATLAAAVESIQVDFNDAMTIETRYFLSLLATAEAKEKINAFLSRDKSTKSN